MVEQQDLQWFIDYTAIRELTARYNRFFDDGDAEAFADTFTPDGEMVVTGGFTMAGRDRLVQMCKRTPFGVVHVTVDPIIDIQGDHAVQEVTILVLQRPAPGAPEGKLLSTLERTGRYRDELVRTAGGWRFSRRTATLDGGI
ncbi:MAG: nuclear transport factor 2 family protein [Acidimicrobiales bacterium]